MSLVLVQLDTTICLGSATAGLRATLSVGSLSLDSISPILFCAPTVQALQLEYRTNFVSSLKTSTLAVQLHGLSVLARPADIQLIEQLAALTAAPEGLLVVEVEREVLSLTIDLAGGTLHVLAAEPGAARVIVELEALRVQTTIRSGPPRLLVTERTHLHLRLGQTQLWLTDRVVSVEDGNWESQGMASIARVDGAALALTAQETTTSVCLARSNAHAALADEHRSSCQRSESTSPFAPTRYLGCRRLRRAGAPATQPLLRPSCPRYHETCLHLEIYSVSRLPLCVW